MPKKKCGKTSCRRYIDYNESYCSEHMNSVNKTYNKTVRLNNENKDYTVFYNSSTWRKLSKQKRATNPLCEHCLDSGRIKMADLVDHIIEIKDDFSLRLTWENLQSLCNECHNTKTNLEKQKRNRRV